MPPLCIYVVLTLLGIWLLFRGCVVGGCEGLSLDILVFGPRRELAVGLFQQNLKCTLESAQFFSCCAANLSAVVFWERVAAHLNDE